MEELWDTYADVCVGAGAGACVDVDEYLLSYKEEDQSTKTLTCPALPKIVCLVLHVVFLDLLCS